MVYNFGSALLRSKGDTKRPMYILFAAGLINVVLNLIFVIPLKMDVAGVALATVISQVFSAFMVIRCLVKENDDFKLYFSKLKIDREIFIDILKIGLPAGFQGILFSFSNVIIQSSVNSFGNIMIAGSSAAANIEGFVYISMNGFAQGSLTFVSQNYGAKKMDRIKKVVRIALLCALVAGTVLGNLAYLFGRNLIAIYNDNPDVIEAGLLRMSVIMTTYALCGIMDVMANSVRGIGHSLLPMVVSLLGACGLRLVWLATAFQIPAFHTCRTVFLSYPISWAITFAAHVVCFLVILKNLKAQKEL